MLINSAVWAEVRLPLGLDLYRPIPEDNPLTPEKAALGRKLFGDKILSRNRSLACKGCHKPKKAFTDARAKAVGVYGRRGNRSVPTLVNRAYGRAFFWDGRTSTLEEQVVKPIESESEMDMTVPKVVERLKRKRRYRKMFQQAFGREVDGDDLARALASYVRTIYSGDSPFDRYIYGNRNALSEQARRGLRIFRGKGNCTACHVGPTLSDEEFHNTGVAWRNGKFLDDGRYQVTKQEKDRGKFKTPTLREIARTAPYMHDGSLTALEDVVDFYSDGGRENPHLDEEIRKVKFTAGEKSDWFSALLIGDRRSVSAACRMLRTSTVRERAKGPGVTDRVNSRYIAQRTVCRQAGAINRAPTSLTGGICFHSWPPLARKTGC